MSSKINKRFIKTSSTTTNTKYVPIEMDKDDLDKIFDFVKKLDENISRGNSELFKNCLDEFQVFLNNLDTGYKSTEDLFMEEEILRPDEIGKNPYYSACFGSNFSILEYLFVKDKNWRIKKIFIDSAFYFGREYHFFLHKLIGLKRFRAFEYVCEHDINVLESPEYFLAESMHEAIINKDEYIVRYLISQGCIFDNSSYLGDPYNTPLTEVAKKTDKKIYEMVKHLKPEEI